MAHIHATIENWIKELVFDPPQIFDEWLHNIHNIT